MNQAYPVPAPVSSSRSESSDDEGGETRCGHAPSRYDDWNYSEELIDVCAPKATMLPADPAVVAPIAVPAPEALVVGVIEPTAVPDVKAPVVADITPVSAAEVLAAAASFAPPASVTPPANRRLPTSKTLADPVAKPRGIVQPSSPSLFPLGRSLIDKAKRGLRELTSAR